MQFEKYFTYIERIKRLIDVTADKIDKILYRDEE